MSSSTVSLYQHANTNFHSPTARVDAAKKYVLVDDVDNGFSLFEITNGEIVRRYSQKVMPQRRMPKESVFADNGDTVVGGSNHGHIYVWDRRTGALVQQIKHPDGGMVQAVAVRSSHDFVSS